MPRHDRRLEPSAPPIFMMPETSSSDQRDLRDRSPPPRYEEAISQDQPPSHLQSSALRLQQQHYVPQTTQLQRQSRSESFNPDHRRILGPPNSDTNRHNRRSPFEGARATSANGSNTVSTTRYRSASPGNMSTGSRTRSEDGQNERETRPKKKRSSGLKIKKGLENIAFFIIQILD